MATDAELAGEALTKRMAHEGLNQVQLARKADVSDVLIRELQQGIAKRRQPDKLARISTPRSDGPDGLQWNAFSMARTRSRCHPRSPMASATAWPTPRPSIMLERVGEIVGELTQRAREGRL